LYKKVLVLGLGNILLKDEGIGVYAALKLKEKTLPDNVEVIDAGTASLDIILSIKNVEKLIIIDALKSAKVPGTIYRLRLDDLESRIGSSALSLHQLSVVEALSIAKKKGDLPKDIVIIGVEPERIDYELGLSPSLEKKLPDIVDIVLRELTSPKKEKVLQ